MTHDSHPDAIAIDALLDRELPEPRAAALWRHLASCEPCAVRYGPLIDADAWAPLLPPASAPARASRGLPRWWKRAAAAALVLAAIRLAALLGGRESGGGSGTDRGGPEAAAPSPAAGIREAGSAPRGTSAPIAEVLGLVVTERVDAPDQTFVRRFEAGRETSSWRTARAAAGEFASLSVRRETSREGASACKH